MAMVQSIKTSVWIEKGIMDEAWIRRIVWVLIHEKSETELDIGSSIELQWAQLKNQRTSKDEADESTVGICW
jgi:hypothetical protein